MGDRSILWYRVAPSVPHPWFALGEPWGTELLIVRRSISSERPLSRLYRYSIRHPVTTLVIALAVTAAIAPGAARLELRTDGHALVPSDAPEVRYDASIRAKFGTADLIVVLIRTDGPEGIYNTRTLTLIRDLTTDILQLDDRITKAHVSSLATEKSHRVFPGSLKLRPFLTPVPSTPEKMDQLRNDLRDDPREEDGPVLTVFSGTVVSRDETATSIFVGVPAGMDRTELFGRIQAAIAARGTIPEQVDVIGAPVAEALLGTHLLEDLGVPAAVLGPRPGGHDAETRWQMPAGMYELRTFIGRHIGLVPVAIGVMAFVFLVSFRSFTATLLPLSEVGACLVFVFGLMGWCGVPVYLTIAVLPVILTAIGVADEIHIFSRYTQRLRRAPDDNHVDVVTATMDEMHVPVVKTSVTTAVGFLSFALSTIGPVRAFGVFTAVGVLFCMLWSLTVVPALLVLIHPRRFVAPAKTGIDQSAGVSPRERVPWFGRFGAVVVRYRFVLVPAALLVAAAAPLGVKRLIVQDSWLDGFAPDSAFRQATGYFNEQFLGTHILFVTVDAGHYELTGTVGGDAISHHELRLPGDVVDDPATLVGSWLTVEYVKGTGKPREPAPARTRRNQSPRRWATRIERAVRSGDEIIVTTERRRGSLQMGLRLKGEEKARYRIRPQPFLSAETIRRMANLERFIEKHRDVAVGGVLGPAEYVRTTHFLAKGRNPKTRCIPDDAQQIEIVWNRYKQARGEARLRQLVDADHARALVTVFMTNANFVDVGQLMDGIRYYERRRLAPHGIQLGFAGDVAVSQSLIQAIVSTQVQSLLLSLVGILSVTALLGRSIRWGLLCVLPCAFAVLVNFAVMGATNMPLGVATSMFAGMTLGIGVDYAIHLLERYRLSRSEGMDNQAAAVDAVAVTGPAIFVDAVAVALGFGILVLSQVPPNARLGALVALSVVNCFVATLVVLPGLLCIVRPRTRK